MDKIPGLSENGTIRQFFAVTKSKSVYLVKNTREDDGYPIVEKIACYGISPISVGMRLKYGRYVGITQRGVVLFDKRKPEDRPEDVNFILHWGEKTSPVVALFLIREDALECAHQEDLKRPDLRWKKQTLEVLNAIGDMHEIFVVSKSCSDAIHYDCPNKAFHV